VGTGTSEYQVKEFAIEAISAVEQATIDSLSRCLHTENLRVGNPTEVAV
jgi:hypothetical protein